MRSYQLTSKFKVPLASLKPLLLLWLTFAWSSLAWSHTLPSGNGTINVNGDKAYVVLSLPVHSFVGVDDNEDGKLSAMELSAHHDAIEHQIQRGFVFYHDDAESAKQSYADKTPHTMKTMAVTLIADQENHSHDHHAAHGQHHNHHSNKPADTVNYLGIVSFSKNVTRLRVDSDFFTLSENKHTPTDYVFKLFAKHSKQRKVNEKPIIREMVTLSPTQTSATFFSDFSSFAYSASQLAKSVEAPSIAQTLNNDKHLSHSMVHQQSASKIPNNIIFILFFGMACIVAVQLLWLTKIKKDIDEHISKQTK